MLSETDLDKRVQTQLTEQVRILTETVNLTTERVTKVADLFQDKLTQLDEAIKLVVELKAELEASLEALFKSINESDQNLDDLATVTAGQTRIQQVMQDQVNQLTGAVGG